MYKPELFNTQITLCLSFILAIVLFSLELVTPFGDAIRILYIPLVFCSLTIPHAKAPCLLALIASVLILAAYILGEQTGPQNLTRLLNPVFLIATVWASAVFVSYQTRTNRRLKESEEKQNLTFRNAPIGMAVVGLDGKWLEVNPALCLILGYSEEELLRTDFQSITHPQDLEEGLSRQKQLIRGEISSSSREKRYITKSGDIVWAFVSIGVLKKREAKPNLFIIQILDISDRISAEEKIQAAGEFKDLVTNTIPDLVFVKDSELRIIQANQAFLNVYPEEKRDCIIGYTTFEEYEPEEVELFTRNDREALANGYHETEETIQFPNGKQKILFTKKIRFEDNGNLFVLGVARDITAIKRTQKDLERANSELEKFSYIASHDLKAPLRGIDNLAQWIFEDLQDTMDAETKERMVLLRSRVTRLETMLNDILEYSRAGRIVEEPKSVDLNELIPQLVERLNLPAAFQLTYPDDIPSIYSPLTPLEQIFSNLLTNAVKHHDKTEGNIKISWRDCGRMLEFSVEDDGPGIPEKYREKAFTLFQTLKSRDTTEGSGLGMSIIKKLVEQQGGSVRIESANSERGTIIKFSWQKISQQSRKSE